ncbi:MAG TPA: DHA2 family efflux MFS transporter permease subunit [Coxiellaceae bacterium]|nr:DHA2 family efflux MFS transporter permease subunit [Coxiellaceae bacterium]
MDGIPAPIKRIIIMILSCGVFMESVDSTVITVAIPKMALSLGDTPLNMKVALTSYLLSLAIFIPISSWFAEKMGTQQVFKMAMLIFTLGSFLCGISNSLHTLVPARILQGLGGAFMMPVGRLILVRVFEKRELIQAMMTISVISSIGFALGPMIGGVLTTFINWRWIFFINIPFGLLGAYLTQHYFYNYRASRLRPFDTVGFLLFGFGLTIIMYTFDTVGERFLSLNEQISLFFVGVLLLGIYFIHAQQIRYPLLDLHLFKLRTFLVAFLGNIVSRVATGGMVFMMPLFLQLCFNQTPLVSGLYLVCIATGMIAIKPAVDRILKRWGYRNTLRINMVLIGIIIFTFTQISAPLNPWQLGISLFVYGMALSIQYPAINSLYFANLSEKRFGDASAITNITQQLFTSIGIGLSAILLMIFAKSIFYVHQLLTPLIFHRTFIIMSLIAIFGSVVFWGLNEKDGRELSGHQTA